MKRTLRVEIECGETTCASEPGKFCEFFGSRNFGSVPVCALFPAGDSTWTDLEEKDGWTQRCSQCIAAEEKS